MLPSRAVSRLLQICDPDDTLPLAQSVPTPRRMQTPTTLSRAGYSSSSRSRASDLASNRETCIWEMPTRSAICVCVIESKNRSTNTVRSRSGNAFQQRPDRLAVLDPFETGVEIAEGVGDRPGLVIAAAAATVDGQRVVGATRHQTLDDFGAVHLEFFGEFTRGGRPAQPLRKICGRRAQPQVQFFQSPRDLDRPAVVPEMPADFPHDGGHRKGDEVGARLEVEAGDGVDQSDPSHLNQVVARFAASLETTGDVICQRQAALDDLVPMTLEFRRIGVKVASSRNMSGTSAYSLGRDDEEPPAPRGVTCERPPVGQSM